MEDQHSDPRNKETNDRSLGSPISSERQEDQEESIGENRKPNNIENGTDNIPDVLAFQDVLREVWHRMKSPDFQSVAMTFSTIAIAFFTFATWIVIWTGSNDTHDLAIAARDQAVATKTVADQAILATNLQVQQARAQHERPEFSVPYVGVRHKIDSDPVLFTYDILTLSIKEVPRIGCQLNRSMQHPSNVLIR